MLYLNTFSRNPTVLGEQQEYRTFEQHCKQSRLDIDKTFHPKPTKYTFLSKACRLFLCRENKQGHKISFNKIVSKS